MIEIDEVPETMIIPETSERVPLVTQGQWMKGCPEGAEQSFLFSLYSQLSTPNAPCPHDCGATISRSKGDFFALHASIFSIIFYFLRNLTLSPFQPNFSTFISRLSSRVAKICPRCHSKVCLACGEPVSADHEKLATNRDDPLFHCSNLQGVILGVGLIMLDQLFGQDNEPVEVAESTSRNTKRRKSEGVEIEEEDVPHISHGKKAKNSSGTGYDGGTQEDVCLFHFFTPGS